MLSRVWARAGTRSRIRREYRYGYCDLFSAFCLQVGTAIGHVGERANCGKKVPEGRHAFVIVGGAGWHRAKDLVIPDYVSLLRLPPYAPETVFPVLKHRHFANRVVGEVRDGFAQRKEEITRITAKGWAVL